jgi:hypothetical protein
MIRIMDVISDCSPTGFEGRGMKFAVLLEVVVNDVLRVYNNHVDFSGWFDGSSVLCPAVITDKKYAEKVATALRANKGVSVAKVWAMELPAD